MCDLVLFESGSPTVDGNTLEPENENEIVPKWNEYVYDTMKKRVLCEIPIPWSKDLCISVFPISYVYKKSVDSYPKWKIDSKWRLGKIRYIDPVSPELMWFLMKRKKVTESEFEEIVWECELRDAMKRTKRLTVHLRDCRYACLGNVSFDGLKSLMSKKKIQKVGEDELVFDWVAPYISLCKDRIDDWHMEPSEDLSIDLTDRSRRVDRYVDSNRVSNAMVSTTTWISATI